MSAMLFIGEHHIRLKCMFKNLGVADVMGSIRFAREYGRHVGAIISVSRYGMKQQHATTITTTTGHADMTNTAQ